MSARRLRPVQIVKEPARHPLFTTEGRPEESRRQLLWVPVFLRLMTLAWAGAIVAALLDEFGAAPHLPFLLAMGMTGLLVAAAFVLTRDELHPGQARNHTDDEDEPAHDLLTSLPTFYHFSRHLNDEFVRARRIGRRVSIVLIDVNNLTAVNREYGVRAGDEVLRHVARVIDATKRYNDVVARLGDDEFGVLLLESGEEGVDAFIERLEDRLARESAVAEVSGRNISLWAGVCSGSATSTPEMARAEVLLEAAMASLDHAKQERERRRRMWLSA